MNAYIAVLGDGHEAVEDDLSDEDTCRRCGADIWWPGPGPHNIAHSDEEPPPAEPAT